MSDDLDLGTIIFGVDFEAEEIVFFSGRRAPVESWRDPLGFECEPSDARIVLFRGPGGLPFALDIHSCYASSIQH